MNMEVGLRSDCDSAGPSLTHRTSIWLPLWAEGRLLMCFLLEDLTEEKD